MLRLGLRFAFPNPHRICLKKHTSQIIAAAFRAHLKSISSGVSAGVIIIGDEILKGQIADVNSSFLIKNLNLMGINVTKLCIIRDDSDAISNEVVGLSSQCTVVITSGGIGPTHDDLTFAAVAKACGDQLEINVELFNLYSAYFKSQAQNGQAVLKLSSIPKSSKVLYGIGRWNNEKVKFPLVLTKNIYMMPGVPMLLEKAFGIFKDNFSLCNDSKFTRDIFVTRSEVSITSVLNSAAEKFKPHVIIGSYPSFHNNYYKVKLSLESHNKTDLSDAYAYLKAKLPEDAIIALNPDVIKNSPNYVYTIAKEHSSISNSLLIIEEALQTYKLSQICLCFNGGKDCTTLLHLVHAVIHKHQPNTWHQLKTLYVKNEPFEEMEHFIKEAVKTYNLNLFVLEGNLKHAMVEFLKTHKEIKAAFMGTRKTDPGAMNLATFNETDSDWPSLMRVMPILDWSYKDVWYFIRTLQIPYCILYDQGYSSIGTKSLTIKNPSLRISQQNNLYHPAYKLKSDDDERSCRI